MNTIMNFPNLSTSSVTGNNLTRNSEIQSNVFEKYYTNEGVNVELSSRSEPETTSSPDINRPYDLSISPKDLPRPHQDIPEEISKPYYRDLPEEYIKPHQDIPKDIPKPHQDIPKDIPRPHQDIPEKIARPYRESPEENIRPHQVFPEDIRSRIRIFQKTFRGRIRISRKTFRNRIGFPWKTFRGRIRFPRKILRDRMRCLMTVIRHLTYKEFSEAFGAPSINHEKYNPQADFDADGDVDGRDLAVFARNYTV